MNIVKLTCVLLWILVASDAWATDVGPGDISGTWSLAGSPYIVQGNITVPDMGQLVIEPGVSVFFDGPYVLYVDGILSAVGAEGDSILFSRNTGRTDWGHIEFDYNSNTGSTLQYCRIEYGNAIQLEAPYRTDGGGIYAMTSFNLSISHCSIEHCRADKGGGVYLHNKGTLEQCVIRYCSAEAQWQNGGGGALIRGDSSILNCEVSHNSAEFVGGGITLEYGFCVVSNCVISDNQVPLNGHGGGLAFMSTWGEVSNNLIYNNAAGSTSGSEGGGAYFWNSGGGLFHHNTLVGNRAPKGAGLAYGFSTLSMDHCIVAFNEGDATYDLFDGDATFDYFCSFGNTGSDVLVGTATNTVNEHPLFCDYGAENFTLCADSPCLPDGIGAQGQGCGNCWPATETATWGRLKTLY